MVIKVKEITISRGRKFAWNYGNGVGYNVGITIEGTTAKDTVEDIIKKAILEIVPMESSEQDRCRNIYEIAMLQDDREFKETMDKVVEKKGFKKVDPKADNWKEPAVRRSSPGFRTEKEAQFKKEKIEVSDDIVEFDGREYKKFTPCKYKCGMWSAWPSDYKQGDRKLHMNPMTKEVIGTECPKYAEGGS